MYILSGASIHIIVISFVVYLFVNLFENMIHYNIGRFSDKETRFVLPTGQDFVKIIVVMCFFALLQGLLTMYFNTFFKKSWPLFLDKENDADVKMNVTVITAP